MSKECINCGAELPDGASFCPHCETVQRDKLPMSAPPRRRGRIFAVLGGVLALALAFGGGYFLGRSPSPGAPAAESPAPAGTPAPTEGFGDIPADTVYSCEEGDFRLVLAFNTGSDMPLAGERERSDLVAEGGSVGYPSLLFVLDNSTLEPAGERFLALTESCSVSSVPRDGAAAVSCNQPQYMEDFPGAALASHLDVSWDSGVNDIVWIIRMTNGDVIRLRQTVRAEVQPAVHIYPEDEAMGTIEELQELVYRLAGEYGGETSVYIHLPAVTYSGGLDLTRRGYTLVGAGSGTVFTGTLRFVSNTGQVSCLYDLTLAGDGGTGLDSAGTVNAFGCTFTGWDTAVCSGNGGWVGLSGCTLRDNGLGFVFDSEFSSGASTYYSDCSFENNATAVLIERVPGNMPLRFPSCRFVNNGEDIVNNSPSTINTDTAIFA